MPMSTAKRLLIATTVPVTLRAFLLPYADHFRGAGWTVDAMAAGSSSEAALAEHFDSVIDVDWSRNPLAPRNFGDTPKHVREAVRRGGYDIVHVHTPVAAFVTRYALRNRPPGGPKVVYTAHGFHFHRGGQELRNTVFRTLEQAAGRWTDRLVVINREDQEAALRHRIVPEERLSFMPGIGLDFSLYDASKVERGDVLRLREKLGLHERDALFAMIAAFNPGKRHKDAIAALAAMGADGTRVHIAFAGDGPLRKETEERASALGIRKRTHFLGELGDIRPLVVASAATLVPSEREGLSRAAMESVCLGVPVIGADARGVRDVAKDGRGLLFPTGDPLALRDAMLGIVETPFRPAPPDPAWRIENLIAAHEALYDRL